MKITSISLSYKSPIFGKQNKPKEVQNDINTQIDLFDMDTIIKTAFDYLKKYNLAPESIDDMTSDHVMAYFDLLNENMKHISNECL